MKNIDEKEKKLNDALIKLRGLNKNDNSEIKEFSILKDQKNQLEIEKNRIIKSLEILEEENLKLKNQVNELKKETLISKQKETRFNEKIDELNQETDNLLDEINKWQM